MLGEGDVYGSSPAIWAQRSNEFPCLRHGDKAVHLASPQGYTPRGGIDPLGG
jgi:hypothetical protein